MSRDEVGPSFHEQVRRTFSIGAGKSHQNGGTDENSPLLGTGNGNGNAAHGHSKTWQFFFNTHETPGQDSHNVAVKAAANVWHIAKATLLSNYVNILLVFVPIGIVAGVAEWDPVTVFVINFLAIIPLASVLSFATEEISAKLGEALGGLLNATFGNAVELIVSIIALRDGQYEVVKSSMIGSILSNCLLVMGMCFVFGGIANMRDSEGNGQEQTFASITAQTTCSLLTLAAASMIIPGALSIVLKQTLPDEELRDSTILGLSRGTAVLLLLLYVLYLWFQLRTHHNLFGAEAAAANAEESTMPVSEPTQTEEEEETHMNPWAAGGVLIVTTVLVSICADYLVDSIDALVDRAGLSRNFIGLILIPIVGNAAEHVTAVVVAIKNKMDLAMGVAIGSSIQISLFVTPFLVILGWMMDRPMNLHFETFETVAFALSVLVVTYTVQDGKSNYLEGAMLMALYIIIAVAFFVTPSGALDDNALGF
ncbi:calcium/proton exchanger [Pestalotiopsis sp. NC0098]|nr:calcium/proton exchanger [Pestalotiopsis sp. NC0098]